MMNIRLGLEDVASWSDIGNGELLVKLKGFIEQNGKESLFSDIDVATRKVCPCSMKELSL